MKFLKLMLETLAIRSLISIFENDAHFIVSKRGWEVLNK
jgi:hypothetical protein